MKSYFPLLFLFIFLYENTLKAQSFYEDCVNGMTFTTTTTTTAQTLCNKNAKIPIDLVIPGATTFTSSLGVPGINNQKILIEGTLVVNTSNFYFTNCKIEFLPGGRLILFPVKVSILNSELYACDGMWQGILSVAGSNFVFKDSQIEDAINAIEARNNSTQQITGVRFNRNFIGYRVQPLANNQRISLNAFQGNTFSGGQLNNLGNGFAGILVENVSYLSTGSPRGAINSFLNIEAGIIAVNSFLRIGGCSFSNILSTSSSNGFRTGIAIQSYGPSGFIEFTGLGNSPISFPSIEKCAKGIYVQGSELQVYNSFIKNVGLAIEIFQNKNKTFLIWDNRIEQTLAQSAINIYESSPFLGFILNNRIDAIDGYFTSAININKNPGVSQLYIQNNIINSGSSGAGIDIHDTSGLYINDNSVTVDGSVVHGVLHILNNKSAGQVTGNSFIGGGTSVTTSAISIGYSPNLTYECNYVDNAHRGVQFEGGCNHSDFRETSFGNHLMGLRLTRNNTIIDEQAWKGNRWSLSVNYSVAAQHEGISPQLSAFIVNNNDECSPIQTVYPPSVNPSVGWFEPQNNNPNAKKCCQGGSEPPVAIEELSNADIQIADGTYVNYMTEEVATWQAEQYLFARLSGKPELIEQGSVFETFFEENQNSMVGLFYNLKSQIQNTFSLSTIQSASLENLNDMIKEKADSVGVLDSLIQLALEEEEPIEEFLTEKEAILLELSNLDSLKALIWENFETTKNSGIDDLLANIAAITPDKDYQQHELDMWELYLNWIKNDYELTAQQEATIQAIAQLCPYEYGDAVYMARGYYPLCVQHDFDDEEICSPEAKFLPPQKGGNQKKISTGLEIYPNPAIDEIFVVLEDGEFESGEYTIFNTAGKQLLTYPLQKDIVKYKLDISDLPSGIYFIRLNREGFAPVIIKQIIK